MEIIDELEPDQAGPVRRRGRLRRLLRQPRHRHRHPHDVHRADGRGAAGRRRHRGRLRPGARGPRVPQQGGGAARRRARGPAHDGRGRARSGTPGMHGMVWCEVARDVVAVSRPGRRRRTSRASCSQDVAAARERRLGAGRSCCSRPARSTCCAASTVSTTRRSCSTIDGGLRRRRCRPGSSASSCGRRPTIEPVGWQVDRASASTRGPGPVTRCVGAGRGLARTSAASTCWAETVAPPARRRSSRARRRYERRRIEAGWPAMGAELTEDTIPAESGVVPVARQLHQGLLHGPGARRPHRQPRRQRAPAPAAPVLLDRPAQARRALRLDGKDVGWLTERGRRPGPRVRRRAVEPPAEVEVAGATAAVEAIEPT